MRNLLLVELPEDKAPKRAASLEGVLLEDANVAKPPPEPITAMIEMAEMRPDCLPEELRKKEDDVLASIALSAVSAPGIERMPKPLWYEIGKQKIHMNSGAGVSVGKVEQRRGPIFIMSMATQWRGHLLAWMFMSNDTETFNEITKSLVKFGDGPWGEMFPPNIGTPKGKSTPITILPK
jgi:hypothetical protein